MEYTAAFKNRGTTQTQVFLPAIANVENSHLHRIRSLLDLHASRAQVLEMLQEAAFYIR